MKIILTIFILFATICVHAGTPYYISSSVGADANSGLDAAHPIQTVSKLNTFTFVDNDSILVKPGDNIIGKFTKFTNGMYIGTYGTGTATWTVFKQATLTQSGNIWSGTLSDAAPGLNTVFIDGTLRIKARSPNTSTSWYTYNTTTSTQNYLISQPSPLTNYTGYEMVVKDAEYIIDTKLVSSQSGDTIRFSTPLTYAPPLGGNGYFVQNNSSLLDSLYEWTDSSNGMFKVYLTSAKAVFYSTEDTVFRVKKKNNVVIENINITGGNKVGIQFDTCFAPILRNCSVMYCGQQGIQGQKTNTGLFYNTTVKCILNVGIFMRGIGGNHRIDTCKYTKIRKCTLDSIGYIRGMGQSDNGTYMGIFMVGDSCKIDSTTFKHIGFNAMYIVGKKDSIYRNFSDSVCLIKNDGSAFYTWLDGSAPVNDGGSVWPHDADSGMYIGYNVFMDGIGTQDGTDLNSIYAGAGASGIYFDVNAQSVKAENNIIINGQGTTLSLNPSENVTIKNNVLYNNYGRNTDANGLNLHYNFKNNFYYTGTSAYPVVLYNYLPGVNVSVDSNIYLRPSASAGAIKVGASLYSFSQWQTASGMDAHGNATMPSAITSNVADIYVNPSFQDSTISLPQTYIDLNGNIRFKTILLHPMEYLFGFPYTYQFTKTDYYFIP